MPHGRVRAGWTGVKMPSLTRADLADGGLRGATLASRVTALPAAVRSSRVKG